MPIQLLEKQRMLGNVMILHTKSLSKQIAAVQRPRVSRDILSLPTIALVWTGCGVW